MKVQVCSDLHLEFWGKRKKYNFLKPTAEILILAGDICCLANDMDYELFVNFIMEIKDKYQAIIHVPGNHEYYIEDKSKYSIQQVAKKMNLFQKKIKNYFYLDNGVYKFLHGKQKWWIIGSTLWTKIRKDCEKEAEDMMSDYRKIIISDESKRGYRKLKAADINTLHKKGKTYIKSQITRARKDGANVIVVTHHKPFSEKCIADRGLEEQCYESNQAECMVQPVKYWFYGHTHEPCNKKIGSCRVVSNPKGYPYQNTKFQDDLVFQI